MNLQDFKREEEFHDVWANSINVDEVMVEESFEGCTSPENRIILEFLGDIRGKKILDLGCGAGEASVYFAKKGAQVTGVDLSLEMLNVVQKVAQKHEVMIATKRSLADRIDCEDQTFDIVYTSNLLHHVNIESTLKEIQRVLKPGGTFVSWDPLAHNPVINIYRRLAFRVRTEDEHPLAMSDLKLFKKYFSSVEAQMTWFFTLWIFIKFFLIDGINPNKVRYWKKILADHKELEKTYLFLEKLDKIFLQIFPFMKRYCWNVTVIAKK